PPDERPVELEADRVERLTASDDAARLEELVVELLRGEIEDALDLARRRGEREGLAHDARERLHRAVKARSVATDLRDELDLLGRDAELLPRLAERARGEALIGRLPAAAGEADLAAVRIVGAIGADEEGDRKLAGSLDEGNEDRVGAGRRADRIAIL